jgi:protoporphyrinogen oxidase
MKNQNKKIAVIGAGPMGLATAYQLAKDGWQPVVFEADDRVGGMSAAFDFGGIQIERFYHFICSNDHATLDLIHELGLQNKLHWSATKMGYYYQGNVHPWGNIFALLKFPHLSLVDKLRYAMHVFYSVKNKSWNKLDQISATHWIKKWIGLKAYKVLWEKLFSYKFYQYSDEPSAAWIWCRIHRVGNSRYNIFKEKFGYLEGGSQTLMNELRIRIEKMGGEIKLQTPVKKIMLRDEKVVGIQVGEEVLDFQEVVSTIPLPFIPELVPEYPAQYLEMYKKIQNIAVVCVILKLKKSVTQNFWLNVNHDEMDIPGLVEYTNLYPLKDNIVYIPFYMPHDNPKYAQDNEIFIEKVKGYIRKINPDIQPSDFVDAFASRYRYAQPICITQFMKKLPPVDGIIKGLTIADTTYYYPEDRGISESVRFGQKLAMKLRAQP